MKTILISIVLLFSIAIVNAQEEKPSIYDPARDAQADIQNAIIQAKLEGKHVLLQIGGNW